MNIKRLRCAFAFVTVLTFPVLSAAQTPASPNPAVASGAATLPHMAPARKELPQFLRTRGQGATAAATSSAPQAGASPGFRVVGVMPTIQAASSTAKYNGITYNGGPIMDDANGVNVYYIWYGDWSKDEAAQTIMTDFITHLGDSPYVNINTTYYDYEVGPNGTNVVKDRVVTGVHYMGSTNDSYSQGVNLTDDGLGLVIQNAVADGRLPLDHNGVYFVLTSADVTETSGFCTLYCSFHGYQPAGALGNLICAFVGNGALQCQNIDR